MACARKFRNLGQMLGRVGFNLVCDWYEVTRFTPTIVRFLQ